MLPKENTNSLTLLTDLVPLPPDKFLRKSYVNRNVRHLGYPRETTVFLTVWTDFVPFPYVFLRKPTLP